MTDRLTAQEFVPQAVDLKSGQSAYYPHCSSARKMIVSREPGGLSAHCFRCGASGWYAEKESLKDKLDRLQRQGAADEQAQRSLSLPEPRVYDLKQWPKEDSLWLYKAGFSPSMIAELGAYWCPTLGRVVLPIMEDGHAIFWQARAQKRTPKILSPHAPRLGVVGRYGRGKGNGIVLCEDSLSAFKVGRECEAWSLLGTKLLTAPFTELLRLNKPVTVWLDSDPPGRAAAQVINKQLRAYGVQCRDVVTPKDPKMYGRAKIREMLLERNSEVHVD